MERNSNPEAIQSSYKLGRACIDHALAIETLAINVYSVNHLEYPEEKYTDCKLILITVQLNKPMRTPITQIKHQQLHSKYHQSAKQISSTITECFNTLRLQRNG
jgi:hypothetical protein